MSSNTPPTHEAAGAQRRAEWTERVEFYAREAVPKNRPFAEALIELVAPPAGARVLDVATGPGIVAIAAAQRIGPGGSVMATDFVPEWEPHLTANAHAAGAENVAFAVMPAEQLDLPDASHDVVFCQFGLMFMPDPVAALREMRRVLRPGGTLGVAVWSLPEKVGLFTISRIVGAALLPPPGDAPPSPMALGEPGLIERLVTEAGFRDVAATRVTRSFEIADPEAEWQRTAENPGSPAARGLASLSPAERQRVHDEAIAALETFRAGETLRITSEAVLVRARR